MNPIESIQESIRGKIVEAVNQAVQTEQITIETIPDFAIEVPREKEHGDFAVNVAMLLARQARMAPGKIAAILVNIMEQNADPQIERVEVAGAGFINFFLSKAWLYDIPSIIHQMGDRYGSDPTHQGKVQVEFVSANPTGNLHMGNARGGAIGDSLANILDRAGYQVEREYYVNDAGNQIEIYADSLEARYLQLTGHSVSFPENGYAGQDVIDTVKSLIAKYGSDLGELSVEERRSLIVDYALQEKVAYIENTLSGFGINYDVWFHEKSLYENGDIDRVLSELEQQDFVYESEGALWFKSTRFGDEKDEVVRRTNGLPTYFAADIAYHLNKFTRGFDWVINVWGADHHGHIARMKGAMQALGIEPDRLDVVLMQLVRLYRKGNLVRMSKRTGTTISLDELIEEVGKDAARFFFVMRSPDSHLDFDMELAKQQNQENPVYYVQYAHARICSIFRQAKAAGVLMSEVEQIDASLLIEEEEIELLRKLADFPEEIKVAARALAPHRIARYVMDLAGLFHSFYNHHRVLNEDQSLQDARLLLMETTRITIKNALEILGVTAPEQM
jgi:arginyl-tRNA synthetase